MLAAHNYSVVKQSSAARTRLKILDAGEACGQYV
jgi:hypothetical protein